MQVKEIMTKNVITMTPKTSVRDAINTLVDKRISGAPVVNDDGTLAGLISEKDLIVPPEFFGTRKAAQVPVSELMAKNVITFTEDALVEDIMKVLITKKIKRVPIAKDNRVTGIVSRRDILRYLQKINQ